MKSLVFLGKDTKWVLQIPFDIRQVNNIYSLYQIDEMQFLESVNRVSYRGENTPTADCREMRYTLQVANGYKVLT